MFKNILGLSNKKIRMTIMPKTHELKYPSISSKSILFSRVQYGYEENAVFRKTKDKVYLPHPNSIIDDF
jgi:hypothetical protein